MNKKLGEKLFVIRWKADRETVIVDGYQIGAIRHSEKKWYDGEHRMEILRECTEEDLKKYPLSVTRRNV